MYHVDHGGDPTRPPVTEAFMISARSSGETLTVSMVGELDVGTRSAALGACTAGPHRRVLVDLSGLQFLDCAGYCALVSAESTLAARGGSLVLLDPVGGPRRLLELIEAMEPHVHRPIRFTDRGVES